jgi:hypothetical protein
MKPRFNPWPVGIVLVFVVLISGMATAVTIALTHGEHLVSDSYYEDELHFQDQIDGATRARQAGATMAFDAATSKLAIRLPSAQLAQKPAGTIEFYRPSGPELDRDVQLAPEKDGAQSVDVSGYAAGLWRVRVCWQAAGRSYFLEQRISIAAR